MANMDQAEENADQLKIIENQRVKISQLEIDQEKDVRLLHVDFVRGFYFEI